MKVGACIFLAIACIAWDIAVDKISALTWVATEWLRWPS
jgi:hypothetical protein